MYPYNFEPEEPGIKHTEIFVAMPFDKKYDYVYEKLIVPATEMANKRLNLATEIKLKPYRTKDDISTTSGWINVLEHLNTARIVLGVLTSNNPNVLYELGIAHATQPVARQILIASNEHKPTFDVKDLIYYKYEPDEITNSIEPLAIKIEDAYKMYKLEKDEKIRKAKRILTPYAFDVMLHYGVTRHFHLHRDKYGTYKFDKIFGEGTFNKHMKGLEYLCQNKLVGLNTRLIKDEDLIEHSYYWTNLGNDVLHSQEIIDQKELIERRKTLPETL